MIWPKLISPAQFPTIFQPLCASQSGKFSKLKTFPVAFYLPALDHHYLKETHGSSEVQNKCHLLQDGSLVNFQAVTSPNFCTGSNYLEGCVKRHSMCQVGVGVVVSGVGLRV